MVDNLHNEKKTKYQFKYNYIYTFKKEVGYSKIVRNKENNRGQNC